MTNPALAPTMNPSSGWGGGREGLLALSLQEAFTVTVRLRSGRQVAADAFSFRAHVKQLLQGADREARQAGYASEQIRQAIYAFVAFLDESVLNSSLPMFADWPRQPLQEELFGDHVAGETFFVHLQQVLALPDSPDLADLLEVYQICLLLGFRGRYAAGDRGELATFARTAGERIVRIRGPEGRLSPWAPLPPGEEVPAAKDPWVPRLALVAVGVVAVTLLLFLLYRTLLGSGMEPLRVLGT